MKILYSLMTIYIVLFSIYTGYKAGILMGVMLFGVSSLCAGVSILLLEMISQRLEELNKDD